MDRLSRAATQVRATSDAETAPRGGVELGRGGQP
jgi:hypothetical protein